MGGEFSFEIERILSQCRVRNLVLDFLFRIVYCDGAQMKILFFDNIKNLQRKMLISAREKSACHFLFFHSGGNITSFSL